MSSPCQVDATIANRVAVYIDGFNLYFGMREKGWKRYYWMNIGLFGRNILPPDSTLFAVKYFTARVASPPDQVQRQNIFLEANEVTGGCQMFFGRYQADPYTCRFCKKQAVANHEKATDVFLAIEALTDAMQGSFDSAIFVSGDADYVPVVRRIKRLRPEVSIIIACPPARSSKELRRAGDSCFHISEEMLRRSLLPDEVSKPNGYILRRPVEWVRNVPAQASRGL